MRRTPCDRDFGRPCPPAWTRSPPLGSSGRRPAGSILKADGAGEVNANRRMCILSLQPGM
ncbi:hypothetical protein AvCA_07930 [Azotobacter vinelandii CA]|uniref:Uncharacterized protein n=2 Tax=Azotobacter vinelandii TaxID=354 RepID=C1DLU0_AZOVD|nr:hypothetical protein Avin_07930 [Azotobacter vinelandii DJ]AGK15512.1 hypothetical protein AvCA_07930 [Azotobacter vinelandii CA]AGK19518.1 hypothetical protein AvCA6_07930 [Azotobacter vinelandii CA6]